MAKTSEDVTHLRNSQYALAHPRSRRNEAITWFLKLKNKQTNLQQLKKQRQFCCKSMGNFVIRRKILFAKSQLLHSLLFLTVKTRKWLQTVTRTKTLKIWNNKPRKSHSIRIETVIYVNYICPIKTIGYGNVLEKQGPILWIHSFFSFEASCYKATRFAIFEQLPRRSFLGL